MTTGFDDTACLEKRGVVAGPNGEDDIQLSSGFRETEGPGAVVGRREARGEYVLGMCAGGEAVPCGNDSERLCPNGAWVGCGGDGSSLACRRNRLSVGIAPVLLVCATGCLEALCAWDENEDALAAREPV
jgi:hypothetical protein